MYASNLSTTLSQESRDNRQRENNFSIWRRSDGEGRIEYTKRCPSCGGELIWLPEKFGEIQQPSGPGPPAYSQSKEPYHNSNEGNYQEIPAINTSIGYPETRSSRDGAAGGHRSRDYRSSSRDRFTTDSGYRPRGNEYAVAGREYQEQSYQHRSENQNYRTEDYQRADTQGSYRDTDYYHRNKSNGTGNYGASTYGGQGYNYDIRDPLNGGWYCSSCGLHLMSNEQFQTHNMDSVETKEEPEPTTQTMDTDDKQDSPVDKANKSIDEEYVIWENQINKDFSEFLTHIKNYFTEKENKLKEYQVDLCQREKSLQANEGYFKERIETLKKAEEEFQDKVERLNLQVQDRMQRLREYESKITRLSTMKKNATKDASVQTQASFRHDHPPNRHSPHGPNRQVTENYGLSIGYQLINKGASPQPQQPVSTFEERRKRLLEGNSARNSGTVEGKQVNGQVRSSSGILDGDYMFMGAVNKTSPAEIAGSPYYIDLQHVSQQGTNGQFSNGDARAEHSPNNMNGVQVDAVNSYSAVDSGFNTPDAQFDRGTNHYQYPHTDHQAQPAKASHIMRPRDRKQLRGNVSNNSNNTVVEVQSTNSGSARNSVSEYGGERAILVKSPNGVESYTSRAQRYSNSGVHRSSSLPQNKTKETSPSPIQRSRSPSPDRSRAHSVPPEQGNTHEYENVILTELPPRPKSECDILDKQTSDDHTSKEISERPRSNSFGSNSEQDHHTKTVSSTSSDSATPTEMRIPRYRKNIKPNTGTHESRLPTGIDINSSGSKVGLRSRSSESVRRSHPVNRHHHPRVAGYTGVTKKSQSEVNLSSEAWNDDDEDEGIVINHRKSTSFDSPRSKPGYTDHLYEANPVPTSTAQKATPTSEVIDMRPTLLEDQKVETSKHGSNIDKDAGELPGNLERDKEYIHNKTHKNVVESLKPSAQDQVYENIKGVTKPAADSQNSSQISQKPRVRGRRSDMSIPHRRLNKMSYYTASGTHLSQNSYDSEASTADAFQQKQKYHKDQVAARSIRPEHSAITPQYNSTSVAVVNYHAASAAKPDLHGNISNGTTHQKEYMEKNVSEADRVLHNSYKNTEHTRSYNHTRQPNDKVNRDDGIFVDVSNGRSNESPEMTSTPYGTDHPTNNHAQKDGSASQHGPKPPQRLYYSSRTSEMNGKIELTDKNNWAIRRRRDQQRPKANEGGVNHSGYTRETIINGAQSTAYYENIRHPQRVKEDKSSTRSKPLRGTDILQKEKQQSNHRIGNSEKYPDVSYHQHLLDHPKGQVPYDGHDLKKPQGNDTHNQGITNPEASGSDSPGKRRLFGFSPKYKEILFKYGNGGKPKSGKPSSKKIEDKNNNNATDGASKSSSKVSSKKGQIKGKEDPRSYKDGREPLSPKSKLPHYNNIIK